MILHLYQLNVDDDTLLGDNRAFYSQNNLRQVENQIRTRFLKSRGSSLLCPMIGQLIAVQSLDCEQASLIYLGDIVGSS